ncbi:RluA family pseudouridine synthase [Porcipelethomonas sp.]|uniref:RluA family pseudouridine synthase n=1 Tax=Porcipelethomonas sp. TaxID=2981675 RepID=UPI003EF5AB48
MKEFIINKNDSGQRTDKFLSKAVPKLPKSLLYKYIRLKRIKVNGKRCEISQMLSEGDIISLYINDEFFSVLQTQKFKEPKIIPEIIYEDENIIIVNKSPGVDVHQGSANGKDTLIDIIKAYLFHKGEYNPAEESTFSPAVCNRLDRNTSGLVIAAKNAAALREINERIRNREIRKTYLCICCGTPPKKHSVETAYLKKGQHNLVDITDRPESGYKKIITEYDILDSRNNFSLVKINLITGRTHQIRAHMSFLGTPVLGDGKYGNVPANKRAGIFRQQLCAYRLEFDFKSPGILDYLNGKVFQTDDTNFECKIFNKK